MIITGKDTKSVRNICTERSFFGFCIKKNWILRLFLVKGEALIDYVGAFPYP